MFKRYVSVLLTLVLLIGLLCIPVSATNTVIASGTCGENLTWTLTDDGTMTISGTGPMNDNESSWSNFNFSITNLVIEEGVTTIGDYAFDYCTNIRQLSLPSTLVSIGESSCTHWYKLEELVIPYGVTTIEKNAFSGGGALKRVHIPETVTSIGEGAFPGHADLYITNLSAWCKVALGDTFSSPTRDGGKLMLNGIELKELVIPEDITQILPNTFSSTSVESVTIHDGVTSIGSNAFYYCADLTHVHMTDSVTQIGVNAFSWCYSLTDLTLSQSITTIETGTFSGCKFTQFTVPSGVTTIGNGAFQHCSEMVSISIPESVTSIGNQAFSSCYALESFVMPDSVTTLGSNAFFQCRALKQIKLSEGLKKLENSTFQYCSSLTEIALPKSLTNVGMQAFSGTGLTEITALAERISFQTDALSGVKAVVYTPLKENGENSFHSYSAPGSIVWASVSNEKDTATVMNENGEIDVHVEPGSKVMITVYRGSSASNRTLFCVKQPDGSLVPLQNSLFFKNPSYSTISVNLYESCTIVLQEIDKHKFEDTENYWSTNEFEEGLDYLTSRGILNGKTATTFAPTEAIQRKTVAMVLWRIAGCPQVALDTELTDVNLNNRYAQAICWAEDAGIITGYADNTFRGDLNIERRHFALMLYRFVNYMDVELPSVRITELSEFEDYALVGAASEEACQWALDCHIINGRSWTTYDPRGVTSRGQMTVILYRMLREYFPLV